MKLSTYLFCLPALALATPSPQANQTTTLNTRDGLGLEPSYPSCDPKDLSYPAADEYKRAVTKACSDMFQDLDVSLQYGFKRVLNDVHVLDSPTLRPMSFELWTEYTDWPAQNMNYNQCVSGFTSEWTGGWNERFAPCRYKKKDGGEILLVRNWMNPKAVPGFATVDFRANLL